MADVPDSIVLRRDRDLAGRAHEIWFRRGFFALLPAVSIVALLNVFGQRPSTSTATAPAATLQLYAPSRLRSGLLYQARFRIAAHRELRKATLLLDPGWAESTQMNTIEPSPVNEASANGSLSFDLGHIPAGGSYVLFMQFQVNPTNVGRHPASVTLLDGGRRVAELRHSIFVFP